MRDFVVWSCVESLACLLQVPAAAGSRNVNSDLLRNQKIQSETEQIYPETRGYCVWFLCLQAGTCPSSLSSPHSQIELPAGSISRCKSLGFKKVACIKTAARHFCFLEFVASQESRRREIFFLFAPAAFLKSHTDLLLATFPSQLSRSRKQFGWWVFGGHVSPCTTSPLCFSA